MTLLPSVPVKPSVFVTVSVLATAISSVAPVLLAIDRELIDVAEACPKFGVVSVGEVRVLLVSV